MENTIYVGKRLTKKTIIVTIVFSLVIAWGSGRFFSFVFHNDAAGAIAFFISLFGVLLLYLSAMDADSAYWSVDAECLRCYDAKNNFKEEISEVMDILKGRETASIEIKLNEIERIQLYWRKVQYYVWNHHAYVVMMGITLKDGTQLAVKGLDNDSEAFVQAIEFLHKSAGIQIADKNRLLQVLKKPSTSLYEYLSHLERKAHE